MFYKFFDKKLALLNKSSGSCIANEPNYQLGDELHKPIIRKIKKRKILYISFVYMSFIHVYLQKTYGMIFKKIVRKCFTFTRPNSTECHIWFF